MAPNGAAQDGVEKVAPDCGSVNSMHGLLEDRRRRRRLTVALCPSNTAYDYELAKLPHDIVLLGNSHQHWNTAQRPFPNKLRVSYVLDRSFDVLILGIDQWSFHELDQRMLFLQLRDRFPGPKIIANHGCNMVDGCSSEVMRDLVQDNLMACSSATAMNLWNVARGCVVRRGLTPAEWPETNYSRRNVVVFDPMHHPEFYNAEGVNNLVQRCGVKVARLGSKRKFTSFDAYRTFLAASAIFFNPSYAVPNPQAMVEAQLCGLAIVTTDSHGESDYIENGENGFASNNMSELHEFIEFLLRNPKEIRRIGANGRRTAQEAFNSEQFIAAWDRLLVETVYPQIAPSTIGRE
jgi:Glycosyl transferases group 1